VESNGNRHKAEEAFEVNGVSRIAEELGVRCVNLTTDESLTTNHPLLGEWPFSKTHLTADVFITLAQTQNASDCSHLGRAEEPMGLHPTQ